jgi:hypothetical protein
MDNLQRIVITTLVTFFLCGLVWLAFSFSILELNPLLWEKSDRTGFAVISLIFLVIGTLYAVSGDK